MRLRIDQGGPKVFKGNQVVLGGVNGGPRASKGPKGVPECPRGIKRSKIGKIVSKQGLKWFEAIQEGLRKDI